VLTIMGEAADQATYYVLSSDVAARTQITPQMLALRSTSASGVPQTALKLNDLSAGNLFTRIPLKAGDVVTSSVVGKFENLTTNLPAGFTVASLKVAPENAVGGRIKTGDYIDIAAVNSNGVAKIVLHHVLVLDVTVTPLSIATAANATSSVNQNSGPDNPAVYGGIPEMYTLAVSSSDFLTLAIIKDTSVYVGLANSAASGPLTAYLDRTTVFTTGPVGDSGAGTEGVFSNAPKTVTP
jgi:Flp pilus assembly protein CpaB